MQVPRPNVPAALQSLQSLRAQLAEGGLPRVSVPRPTLRKPTFRKPALPSGDGAGVPALPAASLDARWIVVAAGMLLVLVLGAALFTGPPAAAPVAQAAPTPKAAPVDPFAQRTLNNELRALRKSVVAGDTARSLVVLGDGSMGALVLTGTEGSQRMVRGTELITEPLATGSVDPQGATLDLKRVRGLAPTRILQAAEARFALPKSRLASLRLAEDARRPGEFLWTATWNNPRTVLYADLDGATVGMQPPR